MLAIQPWGCCSALKELWACLWEGSSELHCQWGASPSVYWGRISTSQNIKSGSGSHSQPWEVEWAALAPQLKSGNGRRGSQSPGDWWSFRLYWEAAVTGPWDPLCGRAEPPKGWCAWGSGEPYWAGAVGPLLFTQPFKHVSNTCLCRTPRKWYLSVEVQKEHRGYSPKSPVSLHDRSTSVTCGIFSELVSPLAKSPFCGPAQPGWKAPHRMTS